jgi:hypothetical protein
MRFIDLTLIAYLLGHCCGKAVPRIRSIDKAGIDRRDGIQGPRGKHTRQNVVVVTKNWARVYRLIATEDEGAILALVTTRSEIAACAYVETYIDSNRSASKSTCPRRSMSSHFPSLVRR